ncbi:MAG: hypothetical protein NC079_06745 [Clostridium sp.]|nr:hypothetical protein [Acetatifactor muris]MCM1526911.1 hypothetical protein [Bacteroides sp.]MCM1563295.1 hypothetical protein [Clostridium sp.]
MSMRNIKETMDRIHIPDEMREDILRNVRDRQENGRNAGSKRKRLGKTVAAAAAFLFMAAAVSIPVQAVVESVVRARMEEIPQDEIQDISAMLRSQETEADGFSREYSDAEKAREKELWQAYKDGMFPEKEILQSDHGDGVPADTLCYVRDTGIFYLPERELTDEEMLEIIDLQQKMSYAVSQSPAAQAAREERAAEQARLEQIVQDADGITKDEALEIAEDRLRADLGAEADAMELLTDSSGNGVTLADISDMVAAGELESNANVAYDIGFGNPETHYIHGYLIDVINGNILDTQMSGKKK